MTIAAVLDTNVLAPGFVSTGSTSSRLIDLWREGAFDLVVSDHILNELERTFQDSYYRSRLPAHVAEGILALLRGDAIVTSITVTVSGVATQPKDDLVLATCLSAGANILATRDKQLLKIERYLELHIIPPGRLLAMLEREEDGRS